MNNLRYYNYEVCLKEIPDEISLGISILGCKIHCPDCHSKHLWDTSGIKGTELTTEELDRIFKSVNIKNGISCILFFGGDELPGALINLFKHVYNNKQLYNNNIKLALYTGKDHIDQIMLLLPWLNYVKLGHYDKKLGGLESKTTNQKLFEITANENKEYLTWTNITNKLWK